MLSQSLQPQRPQMRPLILDYVSGRLPLLIGCIFLACMTSGCVSERVTTDDNKPLVCPPRIQQLANALAIYHARHSDWPPSLDLLIEEDLLRGVPSNTLNRYGYASQPLAVLPDGRLLMLVDDWINPKGTVWCVVQTPAVAPRRPVIAVVDLPWATLEEAAQLAPTSSIDPANESESPLSCGPERIL